MRKTVLIVIGLTVFFVLRSLQAMGLRIKNSGVVIPTSPEIRYAFQIVEDVWLRRGLVATVTSGLDGSHMAQSKHYEGLAVDIRMKDVFPVSLRVVLVGEVRARLGSDYDVVYEDVGKPTEHLHIEYDPYDF